MKPGWKTFDDDLVVDIDDDPQPDAASWSARLVLYERMSVAEVVSFVTHATVGRRLRVWDLRAGGLVERAVFGERTLCRALGYYWSAGARGAPGTLGALCLEDARGRVVLDGAAVRSLWQVALAEVVVPEQELEC